MPHRQECSRRLALALNRCQHDVQHRGVPDHGDVLHAGLAAARTFFDADLKDVRQGLGPGKPIAVAVLTRAAAPSGRCAGRRGRARHHDRANLGTWRKRAKTPRGVYTRWRNQKAPGAVEAA
jgi:hypothetical protein